MERQCKGCGVVKPIKLFPYRKDKNVYRHKCKSCWSKKINKRFHEANETIISVYYLPEEHYVGLTNNIPHRMRCHRQKGKLTDNYEILASFERYVDALWFEILFHQRGYLGCRNK